jgi:signal transduction histidine kinase
MALFRIIQEALTNTAKHARARRVDIRLASNCAKAVVTIVDDGVGFEPPAAEAPSRLHWGLTIMRERAAAVGGDLQLESAPGRGTRLTVEVPRTA